MRDRCAALEAEVGLLRNELAEKGQDNRIASRAISEKEKRIIALEDEVEDHRAQVTKSEDAAVEVRQAMTEQLDNLRKELQEKHDVLLSLKGTMSKLEQDLQKASETHEIDMNKLTRLHDSEQELKATLEKTKLLADERLALQDETFQSKLRELQDELEHMRECHSVAQLAQEREIDTLRQTLTRVRASYEKRSEDFQKAQELSRRLMTVMGGSLLPSQPQQQDSPVSRQKRPSPQVVEEEDLTVDVTFHAGAAADKENLVTSTGSEKRRAARRSMRKEDSAILSELSGLGIQ